MSGRGAKTRRWALALSMAIVAALAFPGTSGAASSHRPDAWIKLCGATNTCLFAQWHPWLGNNVVNTTGHGQTVSAGVEEGNMIRFWLLLQNDGTQDDTLRVQGCKGTSTFPVLSVNEGAWRAHTNQNDVTAAFKSGSATFAFPPTASEHNVILTVTFRANTTRASATYTCRITVNSTGASAAKDTVVAKMTTI